MKLWQPPLTPRSSTSVPLLLGIDVGGTRMRARLCMHDGSLVAEHTGSSGRWADSDVDYRAELIARLVSSVEHPLAAVAVGAHGVDSNEDAEQVTSLVAARIGGVPVRVVNDALLLLHGEPDQKAIGVVAGTGSIVLGLDAEGTPLYAGGWGAYFGDHGSAWGLVREAVSALAAQEDAGELPEATLTTALLHASGSDSLRSLAALMLVEPPSVWAQWASSIFEARAAGSPAAEQVLADAARRIGDLVGELLSRGAVAESVLLAGGVVAHQPDYAVRLDSELFGRFGLHSALTRREPIEGALNLARRIAEGVPA